MLVVGRRRVTISDTVDEPLTIAAAGDAIVAKRLSALGDDRTATDAGTARPAGDGVATGILDRLASLSEPYGTRIDAVDGVGIVEP